MKIRAVGRVVNKPRLNVIKPYTSEESKNRGKLAI